MRTLVLPSAVRDALVAAATDGAPREVCGVLGGREAEAAEGARRRVTDSYPATNAAADPTVRYRIDPGEALSIFERIEAAGETVLGFYHSHPRGPSAPSATDVADAAWPDRSYVLLSPAAGERLTDGARIDSWRWDDAADEFERERIEIT